MPLFLLGRETGVGRCLSIMQTFWQKHHHRLTVAPLTKSCQCPVEREKCHPFMLSSPGTAGEEGLHVQFWSLWETSWVGAGGEGRGSLGWLE